MSKLTILKKGIFDENPIFVLLLGLCSSLAITTTLSQAIGMGVAVIAVLTSSNMIISLLRKIIPEEIRIPIYIVIIATLVKCVQMLMNAYTPELYDSLGVFIALIVVNCIILGRAEAFASKNSVIDSALDGIGMGIGYTVAISCIAIVRELIGTGGITLTNPFDASQVLFTFSIFKEYAITLFTQPAGAFLTFGCIMAVIQTFKIKKEEKNKAKEGGK